MKYIDSLNREMSQDLPLRKADPRIKLAISLSSSLAVMLPLRELAVFIALYMLFMVWANLFLSSLRQIWNLKWILIILFAVDWIFVSLDLAVLVTLRLSVLAVSFNMFFSTTTPSELGLALIWMKVPYRFAFSIGLAFQSLGSISEEWKAIVEAQKSRGAVMAGKKWRQIIETVRGLISITVPAIVLTTRRAWNLTEAAYARGFDSPARKSFSSLSLNRIDYYLTTGAFTAFGAIIYMRYYL